MGQEITHSIFKPEDFAEFHQRVERETALLQQWMEDGELRVDAPMGGCELEAWLVDDLGQPSPVNRAFLEKLDAGEAV